METDTKTTIVHRISPDDKSCVEQYNGTEWVPLYYCWDNDDAVFNLVLDRNEGISVELSEETIDRAIENMKRKINRITRTIDELEKARTGG